MKQSKFRIIPCGLLCAVLALGTAAPLAFTSCENEHPEISITLTSDYSGIIEAINNVNKTLTEKLALIEQGIKDGNLQNKQALDLIQKAIEAMNGTLEQKLGAIKSVIESQTTSLETKLALIETAVKNGFAGQKAAEELIKSAIESLSGSLEQKLEAIKTAIESQTTSLETKLALIETAVKEGLADSQSGQDLIKEALETLNGTLEEKLAAIEDAIKSQTTSLETKLDLIETALNTGFTDQKTALGELKSALESLKGSMDGLDGAIDEVVAAIDKVTTAVDGTNTALTGDIAKALDDIFKAIDGLTDYSDILEAIKTAIENIEISGGGEDDGGDDSGDDGTVVLKLTPLDIHGNPVDIIIPWNPKYSDNIKDTLIAKILVEGDRMKLVGPDETNTWNAETNTDYSEGIGAITNHTNHSQCIDVCLVSAARYGESDSTYVYCIRKYDAEEDVTYEGRFNYVVKARPAVAPGTINGYAYVEMGDGLKWATMNVGATKPEEYGNYFAWGETVAKESYSWATYKHMQEGQSDWKHITKYTFADSQTEGIWYDSEGNFIGDGKTSLKDYDYADDAARQIWKGTWRIPTDAEWTALRNTDNFDWTWTDDYEGTGVAGRIVTSKVEGYAGNCIFLPAAGYRDGTSLYDAGSYGDYWSSSLNEYDSDCARGVYFDSEEVFRGSSYRYSGLTVRPVSE
ncbi:MAG: hypothetical protein IJK32_05530 [Bacteroidales bacterium]|nr:hypothetical protein [Bacteroidales bacterium]